MDSFLSNLIDETGVGADSLKEVIYFLRSVPDVAFIKAAGKADCDLYPEEVRAVYLDVINVILAEIEK